MHKPDSCCSPSDILTTSNTETSLDPPSSHRLFLVSQSVGPMTQIKMPFYNLVTFRVYMTGDYALYPGRHKNHHFDLTYNGGIFIGMYSFYSYPIPYPYPLCTKVLYYPKKSDPIKVTFCMIPHSYTKSTTPEDYPTYYIRLQNWDLVHLTLQQLEYLEITPYPPPKIWQMTRTSHHV